MSQLLDFNSPSCLKILNQMKIDQKDLQKQTFDEFKRSNQNKYNMDESAWELFWESSEEQKQILIQNIQKAILEEQRREENLKQQSYCALINNLVSGQAISQEKKKLEGLTQGKLKDLRFFVEQQICQLTQKQKFTPRYKQIQERKEEQQTSKLNQQINQNPSGNGKEKMMEDKKAIKRPQKQTKKQTSKVQKSQGQKMVRFNLQYEKDYPDQIKNLDKQHLLEIHMMLKKEEYNEMNRNSQKETNNLNQERGQSNQAMQRLIKSQNKELSQLIKAYNI